MTKAKRKTKPYLCPYEKFFRMKIMKKYLNKLFVYIKIKNAKKPKHNTPKNFNSSISYNFSKKPKLGKIEDGKNLNLKRHTILNLT